MDGKNDSVRQLESTFGPLEIRVLDALWARQTPACVRDLQPQFPGVAYTTLMTTLDRLFQEGHAVAREERPRVLLSPEGVPTGADFRAGGLDVRHAAARRRRIGASDSVDVRG